MTEKIWLTNEINDEKIGQISKEAGVSSLIARIFLSRGIDNIDYIKKFINPSFDELYDPFLLKDMDRAVERIAKAISVNEKILIYGDYDVDGITSTSMLYRFLKSLGGEVDYYIPDRHEDGYGLSTGTAHKIRQISPSLVVTVDCGITAVDEIEQINANGTDVVVTDHHECKNELPHAVAVVNPHRQDCIYPFKELAGVGVVFKLISAISRYMNLDNTHMPYLDLAAIGTVADVVPLIGENRIIVKFGLSRVENSSNPGVKALLEVCGLSGKSLNSWNISFGIAPRINAAGRLGDAGRAVRLFVTDSYRAAFDIAEELNDENRYRQDIETGILNQVLDKIRDNVDLEKEKIIVAAREGWHHGVIGIVASKVVDRFHRPCILISVEDGIGKGSGRSIEGFNLFKALEACESLLERYGGHELAAGLTLKAENIGLLRNMINLYADSILDEQLLVPKLRIDAPLYREDVSIENAAALELLAPFGAGNPGPVFAYNGLRIHDIRTVGEGSKHLKLKLEDSALYMDAIGFNLGGETQALSNMKVLDIACSLEINTWNGRQNVQLNIKDIKENSCRNSMKQYFYNLDKCIEFELLNDYNRDNGLMDIINVNNIDALVPNRQDLVAVYQHVKTNCCIMDSSSSILSIDDLFIFAEKITDSCKVVMNYFKVKKCLEIFDELELLKCEPRGKCGMFITIIDSGGRKASLESSSLYRRLQELRHKIEEA